MESAEIRAKAGTVPSLSQKNLYGLADEVADMLDFIFFHTVFMYSLDYWYLVAFPLELCWSYGCRDPSLLRECEEQAGFG